jgi:hypothetical protein
MIQNIISIGVLIVTLGAIAKATYPSIRKLWVVNQIKSLDSKLADVTVRLSFFNDFYKSEVKTELQDQKWILESEILKLKNLL